MDHHKALAVVIMVDQAVAEEKEGGGGPTKETDPFTALEALADLRQYLIKGIAEVNKE